MGSYAMTLNALQVIRIAAARLYVRLGWPGCVGLGCLLVAALTNSWTYQANQHALIVHMATKGLLAATAPASPVLTPPLLPRSADSVQILRTLEGEAKANGLAWPQAEYRITPIGDENLSTLEIQTTLKGAYPQLRKLMADLMDKQPALALRELTLSRPNGDSVEVTAKLRWAIFLADGWPPAARSGKP